MVSSEEWIETVVAGVANHPAGDGLVVDVGRRLQLAGDDHQPGGDQDLTGDPRMRIAGQHTIEDSIRNPVCQLVGMPFSDGFRCEETGTHRWEYMNRVVDAQIEAQAPTTWSQMASATACLSNNGSCSEVPSGRRKVT